MSDKKNETLNETVASPAPTACATSVAPAAPEKRADLSLSALDQYSEKYGVTDEDPEIAPVVPSGEPVFPGLRLHRFSFQYKGLTRYGYKIVVGFPGTKLQYEAEFVSADKKSVETYSRLDELWSMLPAGQDWMDLGFIYNDFYKNYTYCVQINVNDVPHRVSLRTKNAAANDVMVSVIALLKQYGKL